MYKNLTRVTQPASEPITLVQAKLFLRETNSDEDTYIAALISAAREAVENYTRRAFISQTWKLTMDQFPCDRSIELERSPLISVEFVKYWPSDGSDQVTMDTSDYVVVPGLVPGLVQRKSSVDSWPSLDTRADAVEINFTAGAGASPLTAIQAIYLTLSNWYENRVPVVQNASVVEIPMNAQWLLRTLKVSGFVS